MALLILQWLVVMLGLLTNTSLTACTREKLQAANDQFYSTAFSKNDFKLLAPDAKISQNNQLISKISETIHANATAFDKLFRVSVLDTKGCNIATFTCPKQGGGLMLESAMVSIRMNIAESGEVKEIEINNVVYNNTSFFLERLLPAESDPIWTSRQIQNASQPLSQDDLIKVANSYPSGLEAGDGNMVPVSKDCARYENGWKVPIACNALFGAAKFPISSRRWYADIETGAVLGTYFFEINKSYPFISPFYVHEYFLVKDGKIAQIVALAQDWHGPFNDVWGAR